MRILKKGHLPEEKLYKTTCFKCGTEMEFQKGETKHYSSTDIRGLDPAYDYVECPICKAQIKSDLWTAIPMRPEIMKGATPPLPGQTFSIDPEVQALIKDALRREVKSLLDILHETRRDYASRGRNIESAIAVGAIEEILPKFEAKLQEIKKS
jgi:hypothetical protein